MSEEATNPYYKTVEEQIEDLRNEVTQLRKDLDSVRSKVNRMSWRA